MGAVLHILMKLGDDCLSDPKGIFLPIRSFNPNSLLTEDGRSIIALIAEYSDFAIIEDADLRPQDLLDHKNQRKIHNCSIIDMTKTLKLKGNYCYTIKADRALDTAFSGERLW